MDSRVLDQVLVSPGPSVGLVLMCGLWFSTVIYQPNQWRRHRSTESSMRRWWSRPRREVTNTPLSATVHPVSHVWTVAELKEAQKRKKQLEDRCKLEESIGTAVQTWNQDILPNWSTM